MAVMKLTEAAIRKLPLGSGMHRDTDVKGLMVICHKATKTYAVQGDVRRNGRLYRTVRVKIDRVDRIGLSEAKRRAKAIMSQIQSGIDPTAGETQSGITLIEALEAHLKENELSARTAEGYRYNIEKYLGRFRRRAVADLTRQDCRDILDGLTKKSGRTTAASVLRTMKAVINTARRMDPTIGENPIDAIRVPVPPRRTVPELDISHFWTMTESLTPIMRDLQRTFLLTGARRTSVLNVRVQDADFDKNILTFTHMKSGEPLLFPMGRYLAGILQQRASDAERLNSEWLWPSQASASGHVEEPKRPGIPSPHKLRHSARTLMIAAGIPYAESALLLGQRLPGASGGYVHGGHLVETLRPHVQAYEDLLLKMALSEAA